MFKGLPRTLTCGILAGLLLVAPGVARAERVIITHDDCMRLVPHEPAADVAYQAGVDVRGRPVAPADLPDSVQIDLPETYVFDLTIRPLKGRVFKETGLVLGEIAVSPDGRASFNGQPLQSESQAELVRYCRERLRVRED